MVGKVTGTGVILRPPGLRRQAAGPSSSRPFAADTDRFGRRDRRFMEECRLGDPGGTIAAPKAAGTPVGLWEPPGAV
jgi:hypothetical protein